MDHRRSNNPPSSYKSHRLPYEGDGNDSRRNRHPKTDYQYDSRQIPVRPDCLSTRRELYDRNFPVYKQPAEVGRFSLDSKRRFFNDSRQIRYYVKLDRQPDLDLTDGYRDRYVRRDDSVKENLDHLLQWILANRAAAGSSQAAASPW